MPVSVPFTVPTKSAYALKVSVLEQTRHGPESRSASFEPVDTVASPKDKSPLTQEPTVIRRRPTLLAALTLIATAALTLSACGNGDNSAKKDESTAADTGSESSKSSSASPSSEGAVGRPRVELPADLQLIFEGAATGDPVKDAVLADNAERMRAVDAAVAGTDAEGTALGFYNTGKALEAAVSWVGQFEKANATVTGQVRYFDRKVTLEGKSSAVLTFCADESKGFSKDKETGKVARTPVTKDSYVRYNTKLDRNADGVWQTSQIISTRGAAQCRPA